MPGWLPPSATVTKNGWKLIRTFHYGEEGGHFYQLFHLESDPSELVDLAKTHSDIVIEFDYLLEDHLISSNAVVPQINPNYQYGTFDYETLGVPQETFFLPEEKTQENLRFRVNADHKIAKAGENVNITFELYNESNATKVNYRQFMGPTVELQQNNNTISFVTPEVFTKQYISFAFIVEDEHRTIRKQVAVQLTPSSSAPSLSITQNFLEVTKGESATFNIEAIDAIDAIDANKDFINMSVQSDNLTSTLLSVPPTTGRYILNIPSDYVGSSMTLLFSANDGQLKTDQTIMFGISEPLPIQQVDNKSASGGGIVGLSFLILIALTLVRSK